MIKKIIDIAIGAGNIILDIKKKGYDISTKSNKFDFVTTADIESEKYILSQLKKEFPKDSILSEEKGNVIAKKSNNVWMVDPLDGTSDFKNGGSGYSVMIGLCQNGFPVLGVIYSPETGTVYYAQKRKGAFVLINGKTTKIHVSRIDNFEEARLITRIIYGEIREEDKIYDFFDVHEKIPESSVGNKLGLIASAKADFHVSTNSRTSKWDTCAPQILLEEAGGLITDIHGSPLNYNQKENRWKVPFIASNNLLHKKIIDKITKYNSN